MSVRPGLFLALKGITTAYSQLFHYLPLKSLSLITASISHYYFFRAHHNGFSEIYPLLFHHETFLNGGR